MEINIPKNSRLLIEGETISSKDYYFSSIGEWHQNPNLIGLKIEEGCKTIWIRMS